MGSKGRHGWTKIDTFRFKGKHCGNLKYKWKLYGTQQPCPHSDWTWKRRTESKNIENQKNTTRRLLNRFLFDFSRTTVCVWGGGYLLLRRLLNRFLFDFFAHHGVCGGGGYLLLRRLLNRFLFDFSRTRCVCVRIIVKVILQKNG